MFYELGFVCSLNVQTVVSSPASIAHFEKYLLTQVENLFSQLHVVEKNVKEGSNSGYWDAYYQSIQAREASIASKPNSPISRGRATVYAKS